MLGDTYSATRDDVRGPSFAGNDARLIGGRAATRGRRATEGGVSSTFRKVHFMHGYAR
jgi:hypothetical protein